ncbi:MAG TPA: hypothetical protein PKE45_09835, partial [Caldilineaceae bacterium]|nr:hypothetical protein [Caldilineaceae bacterium]
MHPPPSTLRNVGRIAFFTACWLAVLAAGLSYGRTQAQDEPAQGTVPLPIFLPVVGVGELGPAPGIYDVIPIEGAPTDRPAAQHADLNLALRGYTKTNAALALIDLGGETDPDAPQLDGLF